MRRLLAAFLLTLSLALPGHAGERDLAFLKAVKAGDVATAAEFLAAGTAADTKDWAGWTALAWAALLLRDETVVLLLDAGADIEYLSRGGKNSGTPLMMAAKKYHGTDTVRLLVARGADVNGHDQYGRTALMIAARYGRMATVELLLAAGADAQAASETGKIHTALSAARARGHTAVAERLELAGARQ